MVEGGGEPATALALVSAGAIGVALNLYALLGGADFGGGVWDLLASGPGREEQRRAVEEAIGPIWEANHVWLILAVVLLFTAFPPVFADYMTSLHLPLILALLGIVLRGSSFAFRSYGARTGPEQRAWGRLFAVASTVTPFALGVCVGSAVSGRAAVADGTPVHGFVGSWLAPFPLAVGLFAVTLFAFLAAVYLTVETEGRTREDFRRRALGAGVAAGAAAAVCLLLAREDAPLLWEAIGRGPGAVAFQAATALAAVGALAALLRRSFRVARALAVVQVSLVVWGWLAAQYPWLVPTDLTVAGAAAPEATLRAVAVALAAGGALVLPAFVYLYRAYGKFGARAGD
jgi:cytochrome d ubiquinol oxidase subunit II